MKAYFYEKNGKEFFYLEKSSIACENAASFIFDDLATDGHRKEYKNEYRLFKDLVDIEKEMKKAAATSNIIKKLGDVLVRIFKTVN